MNKPLIASLTLHLAVIIVILIDIPFLFSSKPILPKDKLPIIVDLSKLKISERTNLPTKQTKSEIKKEDTKKTVTPKEIKKPAPPKSVATTPPTTKTTQKTAAPSQAKVINDKAKEKPTKKKEPAKKDTKKQENDIKNLLASVEKIKQNLTQEEKNKPKESKEGFNVSPQKLQPTDLSISEKDAIAMKLKECWNLDAGVRGIKDMIIEIKVTLHQDGRVNSVKITDTLRMATDSAFRSVAESAKRAIYICSQKAEESPFYLLSSRHPDKYDMWQKMTLFFNPLDGGVK